MIGGGAAFTRRPGGGRAVVLLVTVEAVVVRTGDRVGYANYTVSWVNWELKNESRGCFECM